MPYSCIYTPEDLSLFVEPDIRSNWPTLAPTTSEETLFHPPPTFQTTLLKYFYS